MIEPAELTLDVERLTFGFDALARHDGEVVFVPYAAPGDRVRARVVERRRGYARAEIDSVPVAGADRVLPGCRYFPTCGGCQWQHVAPEAQRRAKSAIVGEQLARIAGLRDVDVLPTIASPADWSYRSRITLVVEGRRAGYHRTRSHRLVEIDGCPIADPAIVQHLDSVRHWIGATRTALRRVTIAVAPGGVAVAAIAAARPADGDRAACERALAADAGLRGIVVAGAGSRLVAGDPSVRVELEPGLDLEVPVDAFTQVNAGANRALIETAMRCAEPRPGTRALDLYCGAGNFTLPLARRGIEVLGIERSAVAVDAAAANAKRHGLRATFRQAGVAEALARLAPGSIDTVVLDPPRAGAADAVPGIAALRPGRIVYVSCDPATLARDARALTECGWRLARVQPVDLFPQTYHVESVAEFNC